ncbi:RNA-binding protein [Liquorilactobacillus sicerae]|uniref:YlmH family RNA-binding protein n=1 Tax=Liquorilactobacillus sicerae TaxID=1416943 RepID=UPI002481564C|nr:YlmH/Sll1252 family protein [Liquorilactobacillus sicerae]
MSIYQHFRSDEAPLIAEFNDLINQSELEYRPILTHFLNPRERVIIASLLGQKRSVRFCSNGLFKQAERKRGIFYPEYFAPQQADYQLTLLEIKYPIKFAQLEHRQILGTLLASGLKRSAIGDIVTDGVRWQIIIEEPVAEFLKQEIERIGKIKVQLEEVSFAELLQPKVEWEKASFSVTSLRIDNLVASVCHFSRARCKQLLGAKRVHLNWMLVEQPDLDLKIKDVVSVRGFGRFQLADLGRISKKGRLQVEVLILKNNT